MDHVDPDPIRAPLNRGHARHLGERRFGGRVRSRAGTGGRDVFRADHHNPAATRCESQQRVQVMQEDDRGFGIDAHDRTPRSQLQGVEALAGWEDSGIEDGDVDAAEPLGACVDRGGDLFGVGHVALDAEPRWSGGNVCDTRVDVQTNDRGAALQQEFRAGTPDTGSRSCDQGDLSVELRRRSLSELGLLKVPVLNVEDVRRRKGTVATQLRCVEHNFDGVPVDVRGDGCVARGSAHRRQLPSLGR